MALNVSTGTLGDSAPAQGAFPANHEYYVREFIEIAQPELVYEMFGTPKNIPNNSSNTIKFNKVSELATLEDSPLTEGVTPTEQQFTLTRIETSIDQYGGFATTTDRLTEESINGLTSEFTTRIGEQAGKTMNKVERDDLLGGTNVRRTGGVADIDLITASGVGTADLDYIFLAFKQEHVKPFRPMTSGSPNTGTQPMRETYPVTVPVEAAPLLKAMTGFVATPDYASQRPTWMNEYGSYEQFSFILDTEANIETNGAGTPQLIAQSLVFGKDAYHYTTIGAKDVELIIKELGSAGTADPLNQRATIGWKAKKGCVIVQQTYMFRFEFSLGDA